MTIERTDRDHALADEGPLDWPPPLDAPPRPVALSRVGDEIARNALVATGALVVHVSSFDPAAGPLRPAATAGQHLGAIQAALAARVGG